ncbi:MAG TPA: hypothetical protein EYH16_01595 [Leucothrix mucor]|nr:hypothetical protein [Leucothrix mucor]
MKNKTYLLLTLIGILSATVSTASFADADLGIYPPQNLFNANIYPPQTAGKSAWNRMPSQYPAILSNPSASNYGNAGPRMPMAPNMPMPSFAKKPQTYNTMRPAPRYTPRVPSNYATRPSYGVAPRSAPAPRYNVQPRRYTPYPQKNQQFQGGNMGSNNSNSSFPFSGGNMPFMNNKGNNNSFGGFPSNPMGNMFGNNGNNKMPFFGNTRNKKRKKAWGDERNIWPDFYTDFTDEAWDTASRGPRDLGVMPGGWRFPHISTPDPVTVSDAITNQFPPIAEEMGNMMDFSDWGVFDK